MTEQLQDKEDTIHTELHLSLGYDYSCGYENISSILVQMFMWPTEKHLISTGYVSYAGLCLAGECRRTAFPAFACLKEVYIPRLLNYCVLKNTHIQVYVVF